MDTIETQIQEAAKTVLHKNLINIQKYNHGGYSHVYKANCEKTGLEIIIKVYFKTGFMQQEIRELDELRKYSEVAIPEVYGYFLGNDNLNDIFFMECMPGEVVRYVKFDNEKEKVKTVDSVVDTHIAIHNVTNPNGFGDLDCEIYSQSWENLFRNLIDNYYRYIIGLKENAMTEKARTFFEEAYYSFDSVFTEPVKKSSLIHGDYKMKNILIDPKTFKLTAIFDPMGCCYGDREADLFPYINPKDSKFGFLENYNSKICLSEKFPLKNNYYFLWNELKHFVLMGYCFNDILEQLGQSIHDMLKYGW